MAPSSWYGVDGFFDNDDVILSRSGIKSTVNGRVITLCNNCLSSLKDGHLPKLALCNHLHVGLIPPELQSLSIVKEAMISLTCQKGVILQLREDNAKCPNVNVQQGFTGHTINLLKILNLLQ